MRSAILLGALLIGSTPAVGQRPPRFMGFRLGELRGVRHGSYPCSRVRGDVDICTVSDSTFVTFFGDTLTDVTYHRGIGVIKNKTAAELWREVALPWAVVRFGQPDSVRDEDSTATTEGGVRTSVRTITGYWTGRRNRGWTANVFIMMMALPEEGALTTLGAVLQCPPQPVRTASGCIRPSN
jgi:hypothetical protein